MLSHLITFSRALDYTKTNDSAQQFLGAFYNTHFKMSADFIILRLGGKKIRPINSFPAQGKK